MTTDQLPPRPSRCLAGKVAIVTGAGSSDDGLGNGRAIAILLAEDGAAVLCVDRDMASAQRTAGMANAEAKGRAVAFQADVTSSEQCAAMVDRAVGEFGRLDILVNNVGVLGPAGSAIDTDEAEWARGDGGQRDEHDAGEQARAAGDAEERAWRSGYPRKHCPHGFGDWAAGLVGEPAVPGEQGRGGADDAGHGGAPWQGRHQGQHGLSW